MRFLTLSALLLLLVCIALGGLLAFATNPLLYSVEKDQAGSVFHKNPEVLRQLAINSTTDIAPLMQDIIDDQQSVAVNIRSRDLEAARRDLSEYTVRYGSLKITVVNLDMNDAEIQSFMASLQDQGDILEALRTNTSAFDALKKIAERVGSQNNTDIQFSVAGQEAALKDTIQTLNSRYLGSHENIMNVSKKLGLDTGKYQLTLAEVQKLVAEIQASQLVPTDPASLQESRITLLAEPEEAGYRDSVQIFGLVTPAGGTKEIQLHLDGSTLMTLSTDPKGYYSTIFTVERIRSGLHTVSAATGNLTPAERILNVTKTASVTTLTAKPGLTNASVTGAFCNGTVMANHPVRNVPLTILFDGQGLLNTTTDGEGKYKVFLPLSPGRHTLKAQFSSDDYPLFPSQSNEVALQIPSPPISFIPSGNPSLAYGAVALVLLGAGTAIIVFVRRRKPALHTGTGLQKEPVEAVRIREELELIIREAEREFPPAGSAQEAALYKTINSLLGRYEACLRAHGLSEAARQTYLTLAGRIASRLRLPAYRTLTPREMSETCTDESYAGIFDRFVRIYEKIRYGESTSEQDRKGFEVELQEADSKVGGDKD